MIAIVESLISVNLYTEHLLPLGYKTPHHKWYKINSVPTTLQLSKGKKYK